MCKAMEEMRNEAKIEGRLEGKIEGKIEGRVEEQKKTITTMLSKGKTPEEVCEFTDYPLDLIKEDQKML